MKYSDIMKSFCGLPPITPMQLVGVLAFLINDIISGTKNRLLNFIGRPKICDKTTVIGTEETVKPIAGKILGRMPTASALSGAAVKSGVFAGAVAIGTAEEAAAVMKHSASTKSFCELSPITPMQHIGAVAFLINDIISDTKNQLLNFTGRLKIKWRTLTKKITVPHR